MSSREYILPVNPEVVVVHPTSNSNVAALLEGVRRSGTLREFHTSLTFSAPSLTTRLIRQVAPSSAERLSGKRRISPDLVPFVRQHPAYEILSTLLGQHGSSGPHALYRYVGRKAAASIRRNPVSNVVAYEDGAEEVFALGGMRRFYDLPIPYWRFKHEMLEIEAINNPDWANLLGGLDDNSRVLARKDREMEMADVVLSASSVTSSSVKMYFPEKTVIQLSYGAPTPTQRTAVDVRHGPLQALFVGGLTQRKGLSYVFDSIERLAGLVELTVVGSRVGPPNARLEAALGRHTYLGVLSSGAVRDRMRASDVLLLPSIIEGYGLVILEALAAGIPVITTDRTGAADLFVGPSREWIVPASDADAIARVLSRFVDSPNELLAAKQEALRMAQSNSWDSYVNSVQHLFTEV